MRLRPDGEDSGIGSRIAERRTALGLTQSQLGEAVGLPQSAISRIESGDRSVEADELVRIAQALRVSQDRLVVPQALDLDSACARVMSQAQRDEVVDVLRWQDFRTTWPATRDAMLRELDTNTYRVSTPQLVSVPKDNYLLRPLCVLSPRDRVLYEALLDSLGPAIDASLDARVFSNRLYRAKSGELKIARRHTHDGWLAFHKTGKRLYEEYGYTFMLSTDVVSYFEYIDVDILSEDLQALPGVVEDHRRKLIFLLRQLQPSTGAASTWGLPQGPTASQILGNFYLQPIDHLLASTPGIEFVRYMDDIRIFAHDRALLYRTLQDVINLLRARRLNLSNAKTNIFVGDEILKQFDDSDKTAIAYGITIGDPGSVLALRLLFRDAVASGGTPNARDIRFAVYRLGEFEDPYAIPWILEHLEDVPYLATLLVSYLGRFIGSIPEIENTVRDYLADPARNVYAFVEMQLIRMLARADRVDGSTLDVVMSILRDNNNPSYVRAHAARCVGRHRRQGDRQLLDQVFAATTDVMVKRAIAVALSERSGATRQILNALGSEHPVLAATALFLRSGMQIPAP